MNAQGGRRWWLGLLLVPVLGVGTLAVLSPPGDPGYSLGALTATTGLSVLAARLFRTPDGDDAEDAWPHRYERLTRQYVRLLCSAGEGLCGLDDQGRITFANPALAELVGVAVKDLPGRSFFEFLGGATGHALRRTLEQGTTEKAVEVGLWRPDGDVVPVEYTSSPLEEGGAVVILRDVAERLRAWGEVERAHLAVVRAEREKKLFYCDVLRKVTRGKFHLVEPEEFPSFGTLVMETCITDPADYEAARNRLLEVGREVGLRGDALSDLGMAFGEAASNAVKHGVDGRCAIYADGDRVLVRVQDDGQGIRMEDLPASLFERGYSTRISLGMGYTIMLELADTLWLCTDSNGTILQIEKSALGNRHEEQVLKQLLERF